MQPSELFDFLWQHGIRSFSGVPDSLLKDFCAYVTDHVDANRHTITANEGNAIALAAGYHLATGETGCVYMQNSGLGNCVNPLLSLMDRDVYHLPVLLLIGWRGEPGRKDEPQHVKQGRVSDALLDAMGIRHFLLPADFGEALPVLTKMLDCLRKEGCPVACIIRKGTFEKYVLKNRVANNYSLTREEALETLLQSLAPSDIVVSTTGQISREVYEIRARAGRDHSQDFLTVGSMGHASSIALGIALEKRERSVFCLDGDGAFLMHMGATVVNAFKHLPNFRHVVLNNEAHDSVGGQPTAIRGASIVQLALAAGYEKAYSAASKDELRSILPVFLSAKGTVLLEIRVRCGARADLGRPAEKPVENKTIFMEHVR